MNPKRIHLLGSGRCEEAVAAGTIKPGHLVSLDSGGNLVVHPTAGGAAERAFAVEDALQGKGIGDNYSSGDRVTYVLAAPGDVVYAWLKAGQNVNPATRLTSAGDGTLQAAAGTNVVVAVPLESLDLSASGAVATRIRVRVI